MNRVFGVFRTPEGIDYTHPAFVNADNTSRIYSIWDQSIQEISGIGRRPDNIIYGAEYTRADINKALASENPWSVVPSRDNNGHGTFLAGVACGNENQNNGFAGIAPLADICVVKCKEAKQNLKDYYRIDTEELCFMENDIMMGVQYLNDIAKIAKKPLILCIGMGTNQGGHNGGGYLGTYLQLTGDRHGEAVVAAGGNEGNMSHHYHSGVLSPLQEVEVEIRVGSQSNGFTLELWTDAPELYSVGIISPSGEYSGKTEARLWEQREIQFLFEGTVVNIEYLLLSRESGDECIQIRFQDPEEGIWRLRVFNETDIAGRFDVWLPIRNFVEDGTYFLQPDPDITLCEPANNSDIISISYFNSANRSVVVDSGRGFTRSGQIKPDIASPGERIYGPLPQRGSGYTPDLEERLEAARYGYRSGSSMSAAITAGVCALLMEWGVVRRNDLTMNSVVIQKYLIRGADRSGGNFPNRQWGYGTLDLYQVFDNLRR